MLLGSSTGRDGIGGVSVLASAGFSGDDAGAADDTKRPSVQVGDPFEEKRLIEACLELLDTKLVVGIQDLGGAGLACATSETAGRGGVGMDVDVTAVPRREEGMEPWEVMTSESQERMLAIVTPESWPAVAAICAKWEVRATVIGTVTEPEPDGGGRLRIRDGMDGPVLADVPAASLSDDAPLYDRPRQAPTRRGVGAARRHRPTAPATCWRCCARRAGSTASTTTSSSSTPWSGRAPTPPCCAWPDPGCPPSERGVALTTDSNPRACALDPRGGTALALAEGVANLACVGATPVAVVNCLNFGNPEHPEVMWQLSECIDGMAEACRALSLPVIGGNVSLYNESGGADIDPTPGARRARPRRGRARAAARVWRGPTGDTVVLVGPRAAADGSLPAGGDALGHRAARPPHRDGPAGRLRARTPRPVPSSPGWWRRRSARRATATGRRWCTRCTTCRAAGWPWRWPKWRRRPGSAAPWTSTTPPSSSPSCRRASWWPRAIPTSCARRAAARGRPGRRAGSGRRRPAHPGRLLDLPVEALPRGPRGEPGPGPGRTVMARACARMSDA